jgi:hypothetical protein
MTVARGCTEAEAASHQAQALRLAEKWMFTEADAEQRLDKERLQDISITLWQMRCERRKREAQRWQTPESYVAVRLMKGERFSTGLCVLQQSKAQYNPKLKVWYVPEKDYILRMASYYGLEMLY